MLEVTDVSVQYGVVRAVRDVSLRVEEGEIVALLGPNGAGKTTLLSAIAGLWPVTSGSISFRGAECTRKPTQYRVNAGISLCPEGRRVFPNLTIGENLRIGSASKRGRSSRSELEEELLELFPVLRSRYHSQAEELSGGEQQQLAIARALMARPLLLMLDEPSLGLAPIIVDQIYEFMAVLRRRGITLFIVEQHAVKALEVAERVYVLNSGSVEYAGTTAELRQSHLLDAYFGTAGANSDV